MNIGFIGQLNESGHSYVTKTFADALKDDHDVFILASSGVKDGKILDKGIWSDYNVQPLECEYNQIGYKLQEVFTWLEDNKIEVVVFNEMYDWNLVQAVKDQGVKVVGYIDWFTEQWIPMFRDIYDATIISAEHVYEIFHHHNNANFVPWGVDLDLFKPQEGDKTLFFHSAGWGGINYRKGTPEAIRAYKKLRKENEDVDFFLHTQTPVFDATTVDIIKEYRNDGINVHLGSVSHPGLYHKGKVYVGPTKLEGLGLYVPEALACGLPVITTDAYPMKQFVKDGHNGLLVESYQDRKRSDGYYFPEKHVKPEKVYKAMKTITDMNEHELEEMSKNARKFMEENHDFEKHFKPKVKDIIENL